MAITLEEVINTVNILLSQKKDLEEKVSILETEIKSLKKSKVRSIETAPKEEKDSSYT